MTLQQQDPYAGIAALYDLEHDDISDDVELYLALASEIAGPILEMGCGSGRVLAPMAEAGYQVTGIDRSTVMIERAHRRMMANAVAERVTLTGGTMEMPGTVPGTPFGLVLFSLNALMHLEDPDLQCQALASARELLRQDGRLIIDVMNPTPNYLVDIARAPIREWSTTQPDGIVVDKWSTREVNPVNQTIDTTLWYDHLHRDGRLTRLRTEFRLRYVHPHELELMLARAGFEVIQLFGSTEFEPLTEASDRIIAIAGFE